MPSKNKCLKRGCRCKATKRGLCGTHYQRVWRLVKIGKTTWEKHIALGHCLPGTGESADVKQMLAEVEQFGNK